MLNRMETTDIVLHKGEKDEKYQLYVEDYVMSYLRNYRTLDDRNIFFYGRREQKDAKYYIYGAGRQEQISYFKDYDLLHELMCRYVEDMPVFSIREDKGNYDLSGYYIFYHSNEAMQSYMIEQRKLLQIEEKDKTKEDGPIQDRLQRSETIQIKNKPKSTQGTLFKEKTSGKSRGGLMAVQLAAIFVILAAIIINSTNSYTKLSDLNQAATEVFFAMENEKAADVQEKSDAPEESAAGEESDVAQGVILRLEDIDAKFEEENQAVQKEEAENKDDTEETIREKNMNDTDEADEEEKEKEDIIEEKKEENEGFIEEETQAEPKEPKEEEKAEAEQAFARNIAEYYQIEKGDTLCTISIKMYGDASKVREICELNKISDPDHIRYGQKILLP